MTTGSTPVTAARDGGPARVPHTTTLALWAAGFVLCLLRSTHPGERFALWGEDGAIFTTQERALGFGHALTTTYAGYYIGVPRVIAAIAAPFSLRWTPVIYGLVVYLITAGLAALAYRAGREGLGLDTVRAMVLAATVLLLPAGGAEVFGNATNIQWYLLAGALVAVAAWHEGWEPNPVLTGAGLLVMAVTNPLAFLLLPIVASRFVRGWLQRQLRIRAVDVGVVGGLGIGILIELIGHLRAPPTPSTVGPVDAGRLGAQFAARVVDQAALGDRVGTSAALLSQEAMAVVGAVVFVALVIWAALHRERGLISLLLLATSALLFFVSAYLRDLSAVLNLGLPTGGQAGLTNSARYFAVPALAVVAALLVLLPRPTTSPRRSPRLLGANAVLLALVVLLAANLPVDLHRYDLGGWRGRVQAARVGCLMHPEVPAVIANAPGGGFGIRLSCHDAFGG